MLLLSWARILVVEAPAQVIHQPQIYGFFKSCLHMSPSRFLRTPLFRFHQDCFSLSSLSREVGRHTRWYNWILIYWHLPSRKVVHSSEPVISNPSKLPQVLGFPHNSLSCWRHIRQTESPAMCLSWIRLHRVESTASLGVLIREMRITERG